MELSLGDYVQLRKSSLTRLSMLLRRSEGLVEAYVTNFGLRVRPDSVNVIASGLGTELRDPAFEISVVCPVCGFGPFQSYMVRGDSQRTDTDDFMVPVRSEAVRGFWSCNPLPYQIHICPGCGYASLDRDEFPSSGTAKAKRPLRLPNAVMAALRAGADERREIIQGVDPSVLFARPRDLEGCLFALRMGIASERPKAEAGLARARFRTGTYYLREAAVYQAIGEGAEPDEWVERARRAALESLEAEYAGGGSEEVLGPLSYLLLMLSITLADDRRAGSYYQAIDKMQPVGASAAAVSDCERWKKRAKDLWADWRERRRIERNP
jgi:sarcosine oxidase delta subunit